MTLETAPTVADVRAEFPEIAVDQFPDHLLNRSIQNAMLVFCADRLTTLYLAAHFAVVEKEEGNAQVDEGTGVVTMEKLDGKSITYRNDSDSFYGRTLYGRLYLERRKSSPAARVPYIAGMRRAW